MLEFAALDLIAVATGLTAGVALAAIHLGGLWLTVRALPTSRVPALLLIASFVLRTGLVVAGALLVAGNNWQALVSLALGFLTVRLISTRMATRTMPPLNSQAPLTDSAE